MRLIRKVILITNYGKAYKRGTKEPKGNVPIGKAGDSVN
jgi:hypothetical protein